VSEQAKRRFQLIVCAKSEMSILPRNADGRVFNADAICGWGTAIAGKIFAERTRTFSDFGAACGRKQADCPDLPRSSTSFDSHPGEC
jgi:hypothetical protein